TLKGLHRPCRRALSNPSRVGARWDRRVSQGALPRPWAADYNPLRGRKALLPHRRGRSMMRVAGIYDIHGNLPALDAVLHDIRQADVDFIVVGGDVVPGPMPCESLTCLRNLKLPVQFIQGNGEAAVLA